MVGMFLKGEIFCGCSFHPKQGMSKRGKDQLYVYLPNFIMKKTNLGLFCPITSKGKGYPFEVPLPADCPVRGVILADQIRNLDWNVRKASFIAKIPEDILREVLEKIQLLLFY